MTPHEDPAMEAALCLIVDPNRDRTLVPEEMMNRVFATAAVIRSAYAAASKATLLKDRSSHRDLKNALQKACELIRTWHGEAGWQIYWQHAPELAGIRKILAELGS